jgi:hypothetical protein
MFLSDFSIKRPIPTIVLILAMMCLGLLALKNLRVNQNPDVEVPIIVINIPYPGASPETVEREIVNRLEKSLQSISGATETNSTAAEGMATIVIQFSFKKNLIEASDEIRNAIAAVRYKLPTEMREPMLQRIDTSAQPIMQLALSSNSQSHAALSRLGEDVLAERFRAVAGVAVVNVSGALKRELSVLLRSSKLREYNVSALDVVQALRNQNTNAPVGKVRGEFDEKSIRLVGRIESPQEFGQVVVKRRGAEIVRLAQVATIEDGFAEINSLSIRSGKPNVGIAIIRARDASTVSVAVHIRALAAEMRKTLPAGTTLDITRDGGDQSQLEQRHRIAGIWRRADDFRRVCLPQFVALDADHGAQLADVGDRRVHRRVAVRLHAQFHDAAWLVAGDRRTDRRCDRGARKHCAPHANGVRSAHCRARRHARNRPGGRGHHVFNRRRLHSGRIHAGHFGRMVPSVRADRHLFGVGQPVHFIHAGPDVVGLLGRSAGPSHSAENGHQQSSGPLQ